MFKITKKVLPFMIVALAVLLAALPLFLPGFIPTHDGEYHLIRFYEFENMFRAGHWFPRWAPGLNSGYGLPLFNFFYPFPNYIGSLFHSLGASLVDSFKLSLATGYVTSVLFCYLWLEKLFSKRAAAVGAAVFAFVPYWFVDLYVRGSVGEVLAISWFMLLLTGIERKWKYIISLAIAGIILSHNILSMLFVPLGIGYAMLRSRGAIGSMLLGTAVSAYFWLPAMLERNYVIGLNVVNFKEHFPEIFQLLIPSWGTGFSQAGFPYGEMSQQIGIAVIVVSIWAGVSIFREKERKVKGLIRGSLLLLLCIGFLMLEVSRPLWELLSPLQLLQYPWRLLSVVIPISGLLSAYIINKYKERLWSIGIILIVVVFAFPFMRPVTYEPREDAYYLSRHEFTDGTSSLGNSFSTVWSPWKRERAKDKVEIVGEFGEIREVDDNDPVDIRFTVVAQKDATVRVNTIYYPGWAVMVDGGAAIIDYQKDGIITFSVSAGQHAVRVYLGETPLRKLANIISLVSLLWIATSGILTIHAHRNKHHTS